MKKIAYIMHVSWGWIKQRPHFLAENLSSCYNVNVITKKSFVKSQSGHVLNSLDNNISLNFTPLYRFPFEHFSFIRGINRLAYTFQLRKTIKKSDIVWFTSPHYFSLDIIRSLNSKIVVYDCMDDILEFDSIKQDREKYLELEEKEKRLYKRADIVISSSKFLKEKLINRNGHRDITVVNNAIKSINKKEINQGCDSYPDNIEMLRKDKSVKLVYIGTISSWFDFELIYKITSELPNVVVYIYGPSEIEVDLPQNVKLCGSIEHDLVFDVMDFADVLVMPFVVTELIRSVNPVKLYEYIYSGKPCLAPRYGESEYFEDYVYLYTDHENCVSQLKQIISSEFKAKQNIEECHSFAEINTWDERANRIMKILHNVALNTNG